MQGQEGKRRQIERAKLGHENGITGAGNRVVNRAGVFQPGEHALVRVAQLLNVARQLRELRQVQPQRRRRKIEQDVLNLLVPGQPVDFPAQVKERSGLFQPSEKQRHRIEVRRGRTIDVGPFEDDDAHHGLFRFRPGRSVGGRFCGSAGLRSRQRRASGRRNEQKQCGGQQRAKTATGGSARRRKAGA